MYEEVYCFEHLYEAHRKARRGKRDKREVIEFELDLACQLYRLQYELQREKYVPKEYRHFTIHDPKTREIYALQYRDRVVQHSLCDNVIRPYMERHLIYDNAASREGKGTHFAMGRLTGFMREFAKKYGTDGYILKFDIRKYYDSISHEILFRLFQRAFAEDGKLLRLIRLYIDSYESTPGCGLPLGNQTSQWFALYYLDGLDRLIKEKFRIKYYTRYMDDGILLHTSRRYLKDCLLEMKKYLWEEKKLEFKQKAAKEKTQEIPPRLSGG